MHQNGHQDGQRKPVVANCCSRPPVKRLRRKFQERHSVLDGRQLMNMKVLKTFGAAWKPRTATSGPLRQHTDCASRCQGSSLQLVVTERVHLKRSRTQRSIWSPRAYRYPWTSSKSSEVMQATPTKSKGYCQRWTLPMSLRHTRL